MNCFNHPEETAVATCIDCGKGLCKSCASLYQMPICNECNLKRVKSEKGNILRVYLPSIILFIAGLVFGIINGSFVTGIMLGWASAGIPWGWKIITFIQPRMFLFLPILGWILYFGLKFLLSYIVGVAALPVGIVKMILDIVSARKKEKNVKDNLNSNLEEAGAV